MYGIFTYIWLICMLHVGKYTMHGSYGYVVSNVLRFSLFFGGGERLFFSVSKSDSLKHSMLRNRLPLSPLRALRIGDFHPTCPHLQNAHNGISHWLFLADKTTCLAYLVSHLENKPSTRGLFGKYSQSFSKHVVPFVEGPRRKQLRTICLFSWRMFFNTRLDACHSTASLKLLSQPADQLVQHSKTCFHMFPYFSRMDTTQIENCCGQSILNHHVLQNSVDKYRQITIQSYNLLYFLRF